MRTKEIVGVILALTLFLGIAPIALAAAPGTPFQVGGHVYLGTATVSGADVTVTDLNTGESLTTTTDSNGAYVVALGNLPSGHSAGDIIQVTATYNGQTDTNNAPRSESLSDSPQIIDVTIVAQAAVQIRAEDGTSLPASILVDETFTVLITEDGSPVGADTSVAFMLPHDTGDPVYLPTDDGGKVRYKPLITGILGIRVLDGLVTVAEATVEVTESGVTKQLDRVEISPDSADLLIGETQPFTATCYATDATGGGTISDCTLTWNCDTDAVGTIDSSGLFTAGGVGTATVTASVGSITSNAATVNVSAPTKTVDLTDEDSFSEEVDAGTAADVTVDGTFDHDVTGSIGMTPVADPEETVGSYAFTGYDEALMGLTMTPDDVIAAELADGNDTIRIEICYNATQLASKGISSSTLALWRFNESTNEWVKMVAGTPPCVANGIGITGNCVWIEVNNLSTFALVGTKTAAPTPSRRGGGGGGGATYPPGWYATPGATATAVHGATPGATPGVTPPGEAVTKPTKPVVAEKATPEGAEAAEAPTKKKGIPGFTAVFAIAGLLAVAYAMMRRRD